MANGTSLPSPPPLPSRQQHQHHPRPPHPFTTWAVSPPPPPRIRRCVFFRESPVSPAPSRASTPAASAAAAAAASSASGDHDDDYGSGSSSELIGETSSLEGSIAAEGNSGGSDSGSDNSSGHNDQFKDQDEDDSDSTYTASSSDSDSDSNLDSGLDSDLDNNTLSPPLPAPLYSRRVLTALRYVVYCLLTALPLILVPVLQDEYLHPRRATLPVTQPLESLVDTLFALPSLPLPAHAFALETVDALDKIVRKTCYQQRRWHSARAIGANELYPLWQPEDEDSPSPWFWAATRAELVQFLIPSLGGPDGDDDDDLDERLDYDDRMAGMHQLGERCHALEGTVAGWFDQDKQYVVQAEAYHALGRVIDHVQRALQIDHASPLDILLGYSTQLHGLETFDKVHIQQILTPGSSHIRHHRLRNKAAYEDVAVTTTWVRQSLSPVLKLALGYARAQTTVETFASSLKHVQQIKWDKCCARAIPLPCCDGLTPQILAQANRLLQQLRDWADNMTLAAGHLAAALDTVDVLRIAAATLLARSNLDAYRSPNDPTPDCTVATHDPDYGLVCLNAPLALVDTIPPLVDTIAIFAPLCASLAVTQLANSPLLTALYANSSSPLALCRTHGIHLPSTLSNAHLQQAITVLSGGSSQPESFPLRDTLYPRPKDLLLLFPSWLRRAWHVEMEKGWEAQVESLEGLAERAQERGWDLYWEDRAAWWV